MALGVQVWSQTVANNATADSGFTWAEGMAPALVNNSARGTMASVALWRDDNNGTLVTSGSSQAFTLATNQVEGALTAGYTVACQFHATNDTSATINVDALGAAPIQCVAGTNLAGGEFAAGSIARFTYSSTGTGQWLLTGFTKQAVAGFISASAVDQVFSGGVTITSFSIGTPAAGATVTPDPGDGPLQFLTNNGHFTLGVPANDGACNILFTNGATAGAVTFSGSYSVGNNIGDALGTSNGSQWIVSILRINGISTYYVRALQ